MYFICNLVYLPEKKKIAHSSIRLGCAFHTSKYGGIGNDLFIYLFILFFFFFFWGGGGGGAGGGGAGGGGCAET